MKKPGTPRSRGRAQRKKTSPGRNPFYYRDKSTGGLLPTAKLLHLVWCANYEEDRANIERHCQAHGYDPVRGDEYTWVAYDELTLAFFKWIHTGDADGLERLVPVVRDHKNRFGDLSVRDRATIYMIRAANEILGNPYFDSERPAVEILVDKTLELWAPNEARLKNETVAEQKERLKKKVRWTSLVRNLRPKDFTPMHRGRPTTQKPAD